MRLFQGESVKIERIRSHRHERVNTLQSVLLSSFPSDCRAAAFRRSDLLSIDGTDCPHLFSVWGNWYLQPPHGRRAPTQVTGLSVSEQRTRGVTPCFVMEHEPHDPLLNPAGITELTAWALPQQVHAYNVAGHLRTRVPFGGTSCSGLIRQLWTTHLLVLNGQSCETLPPVMQPASCSYLIQLGLLGISRWPHAGHFLQANPVATPNYGAPEALRVTEPLWEFDGVAIRHTHARAACEALDDSEAPDPVLLTVVYALLHVADTAGAEASIVAVDEPFAMWFSSRSPSDQSFVAACLGVYSRVATMDGLLEVDASFQAIAKLQCT